MSEISVIIPARNAAGTLAWALDGLSEQDLEQRWEVVLVDDGSTDGTAAIAEASELDVRIVAGGGVGPAHARNLGVAASSGARLAFLDADCRPSRSWLRVGVAALADADMVQGATHADPARRIGPFDRTLWVRGPSGLFESANLFVRRELFEALGGFESWLGPAGGKELGEDVWFGWRAARRGARIDFCDDALVHHAVFERRIQEYVAERARLRFFPTMAKRIPELRTRFLYRRCFLSRRSATFDLSVCAVLVALRSRRPIVLLACVPYLKALGSRAAGGGVSHAAKVALGDLLADSVGLLALLVGTAQARSVVL